MKKLILFLLIAFVAILISCQKDSITVVLKLSGNLNVQIIDSTGKSYPNVKVHLYTFYSYSSGGSSYSDELDLQKTDSKGSIAFGTIQQGTYYVVSDTIRVGNKIYAPSKTVQILSGETKSLVINVQEYTGTFKLQISIYTNGLYDTINRKNLRVALIRYTDYNSRLNRQAVINRAVAIQNSDGNGMVEFDNIPSNISYYPYVYLNNTDSVGGWGSSIISVNKGGIYSSYINVYLRDLYVPRTNVKLTITYYSSSSSSYVPLKAANVLLINYNDYSNYNLYNASLNVLNVYKVASGTTDNNGVITLTGIPVGYSYYPYVYIKSTNVVQMSSLSIYNQYDYTFSLTADGYYLGLN